MYGGCSVFFEQRSNIWRASPPGKASSSPPAAPADGGLLVAQARANTPTRNFSAAARNRGAHGSVSDASGRTGLGARAQSRSCRPSGPTRAPSRARGCGRSGIGRLGGHRCMEPCGPVRRCEALLCLVPRAKVPRANALQQIRFQFSRMGGFRSLHIEYTVTDRGCVSISSTVTVL